MMKSFEEIYGELKSDNNSELYNAWEEAKKTSEKAKKIAFIVCLILDIIALVFYWPIIMINPLIYIFVGVIANFVIYFVLWGILQIGGKAGELRNRFKSEIINKLINNFYSNVHYMPNGGMSEYIYRTPRYEYYERYYSEDYYIERQRY